MRTGIPFALSAVELDAERLLTPFAVHTKWHAIVGAPSCGKTTLIHLLSANGFKTVPEPARTYMEGEIELGRTIEDIHRDGAALQRTLAQLQSAVEASLPPDTTLFLDGSLPSSLSWYRAFGLDPNELLPECFRRRYAAVYLLDPLPLDIDNVRFDDAELTGFIHSWITTDFRSLGYEVIRVPVLPPEARLALVLDHLATSKGRHAALTSTREPEAIAVTSELREGKEEP